MIAREILAEYEATRPPDTDRSVLCHAPFISLNFDQSGRVTSCCYNRSFALGTYPEQSVREIWTSQAAELLREAFRTGSEAPGCDLCFDQLKNRNYPATLMRNFDRYARKAAPAQGVQNLPLMLEFEISNTCSLECVMCGGHWSSAIRERREKLPPIRTPYDSAFVEQIAEFLPTIKAAKFLGGEPFLITRYYEIWELIRRVNPEAQISITTSGAVIPARPRELLEHLRASIVVSLDGITAATYESIRKNARFDQVMENIEYLRAYVARRGTHLTIAVCPMKHNWHELGAIVQFAEDRQLSLWFNTVTYPPEASLAACSEASLIEIIARLEDEGASRDKSWGLPARDRWHGLLNHLRGWLREKQAFLRECAGTARAITSVALRQDLGERNSIVRVAELLIVGHRSEQALLRKDTLPDQGCWLPHAPFALRADAPAPSTSDLLRAANLMRRFAGSSGDGNIAPAVRATVQDEDERLRLLADELSSSPASVRDSELLGTWMREKLQDGQTQLLFDAAALALTLTHEAGPASSRRSPGELRREINSYWTSEALEGVEPMEQTRASRFLAVLLKRLEVLRFPVGSLGIDTGTPRTEEAADGPIHSLDDLRAALRAMRAFHRSDRPHQHDVFCGRLDAVLLGISGGISPAALEKLQQVDTNNLYSFLVSASDQQLADALREAS